MSIKYILQKSTDYGYSWEEYGFAGSTEQEAKTALAEARAHIPKRNGLERYRICVVEPLREDPKLEFVENWLTGLTTGLENLQSWLEDNYLGRKVHIVNDQYYIVDVSNVTVHVHGINRMCHPNLGWTPIINVRFADSSDELVLEVSLDYLKDIRFVD